MTSPPAPTQRRYYGWLMVVIAAAAMVATLPGRTHGLGMITERLLADETFGIDRTTYGDFNLWATLLGALFCLPCGWMIDRWGLRFTLTLTLAALAASVLGMTVLAGPWSLFTAILLTRGFGQSALSVISISIVGKWFRGRISVPMAVYSALLSLGFAAAAQLAKPYATAEWSTVWGTMGWILLGFVPLAWLLTREPNDAPPPAELETDPGCCAPVVTGRSHTLAQALSTPAFWAFALATSLVGLIGSGISLFNESIIRQQGFSAALFYDVLAWTFLVGLLTKLLVAWLAQRCSLPRMEAVGLLLLAAAVAWLPHIHDEQELTLYAVVMGISGTTTTVLFFTIWGQAFGQRHLGQIQAAAQMMTVVASAIGPKLLAESHARAGSYVLILQLLAGTAAVMGVLTWFVRLPDAAQEREPAPNMPPLQLVTSQET